MTVTADPFETVMEQVWAMLEANTTFSSLVLARNRVKYDVDNPKKSRVSRADKPEVRLIPVSIGPDGNEQVQRSSSSSAFMVLEMELQISTAEQRLVPANKTGRETVFRVLWEALRSTWAWHTYLGAAATLQWDVTTPKTFRVHRFSATAAEIGVLVDDLDRGAKGWSSLVSFEVAMNFGISVHE